MSEEGGGASRSTDPAAGTSASTDVSLREYLTSLISAVEKRLDARFEEAQRAISKAEAATEKRLESMNEFRDTLSDQATHFVTKDAMASLVGKLESQIERNREDLDALSQRIDLREGAISGSRLTWGNMAALLASFATVIGLVVVLANYLSTQ